MAVRLARIVKKKNKKKNSKRTTHTEGVLCNATGFREEEKNIS